MGIFDFIRRNKPKTTKRNYAAASKGRLFADFKGSNRSADSEIRWALRDIRNRSRDLERNNEYFRRYLQLLRTNVIGEGGFNLQVKAKNPDGSLDRPGNNIIENAWRDFSKVGHCTVDARLSMVDLCNHIITGIARDGEVFLQIIKGNYLKHGIALQIIEPDLIDEEKNELTNKGNQVRMGIELDEKTKKPIAYHVLNYHKGDYDYMLPKNERKYTVIPADEMMHIYRVERAGQTRGVPWSAAAISSLKMLHGYREAELIAARTGAAKMGFFTSPAGDGFTADSFDDADNSVPIYDAEAGTFHQLPAGVDFTAFDPTHPTSAFADFEKAILRGIAGGLGVSYTSLANDLESTSYSSIRQGALEERDFYKTLHRFMIDHFLDPFYNMWLENIMSFNFISISGIEKIDKFKKDVTWRGRGFQWVDPLKEMNAAVIGLQHGILSHTDIAANYGRDAEDTFAQIQRDQDTATAYGMQMAYQPFGEKLPVIAEGQDVVQAD